MGLMWVRLVEWSWRGNLGGGIFVRLRYRGFGICVYVCTEILYAKSHLDWMTKYRNDILFSLFLNWFVI